MSIEHNSQQLDLRVPVAVTLGRLTERISHVFHERNIAMPPQWYLRVKGKPIALGDFDVIADFPIGNGDVFGVVTPQPSMSGTGSG